MKKKKLSTVGSSCKKIFSEFVKSLSSKKGKKKSSQILKKLIKCQEKSKNTKSTLVAAEEKLLNDYDKAKIVYFDYNQEYKEFKDARKSHNKVLKDYYF